jgi:hypothetical protein
MRSPQICDTHRSLLTSGLSVREKYRLTAVSLSVTARDHQVLYRKSRGTATIAIADSKFQIKFRSCNPCSATKLRWHSDGNLIIEVEVLKFYIEQRGSRVRRCERASRLLPSEHLETRHLISSTKSSIKRIPILRIINANIRHILYSIALSHICVRTIVWSNHNPSIPR